jgi:hypothetical protein
MLNGYILPTQPRRKGAVAMKKHAIIQVSTHWFGRWVSLIHLYAIGFLLAGCAYNNYADSIRPPARFDYPFAGEMTIVEVGPEEIWDYCSKGVACVVEVTSNECRVIFNGAYAKLKSAIMRHETAHCNGWSGAHEP